MIRNTRQTWEVGATVKVGFMALVVTEKVPTPGDFMPDMYRLVSRDGSRHYEFVPHKGLRRVESAA